MVLIHEYLGLGDSGNRESIKVKKFNLNLILTCNIYMGYSLGQLFYVTISSQPHCGLNTVILDLVMINFLLLITKIKGEHFLL